MSALRRLQLDPNFLLIVLLAVFAWAPLTYPGFFETHANPWLTSGTKEDVFLALSVGGIGIYGWSRRFIGRGGGLLAAVVYLYWPYNLATIYVRGALNEVSFMALLPLTLWALYTTLDNGTTTRRILSHGGFVLLLVILFTLQTGLALLVALLSSLCHFILDSDRPALPRPLAVWLLFPVILAFMNDSIRADFLQHAVYPFQLFSANWGHGASMSGWMDTLPLGLGMASLSLAALGLIVGWPRAHRVCYFALSTSVVLIFLATTWAAPMWRLWPGVSLFLDYPWQLYALAAPFLALLAGGALPALLAHLKGREVENWTRPLQAGLIGIVILASANAFEPLYTHFTPPVHPPAYFGNRQTDWNLIALIDIEEEGTPEPGNTIQLHAAWQAMQPLEFDYSFFVHVVNGDGSERVAQVDTQPQGGARPMTTWRVGEIITDTYEVTIPQDAPDVNYRVIVGVYNWQTGERLSRRLAWRTYFEVGGIWLSDYGS